MANPPPCERIMASHCCIIRLELVAGFGSEDVGGLEKIYLNGSWQPRERRLLRTV